MDIENDIRVEFRLPQDCLQQTDLVDAGFMDSLQLLELVAFVEERAGLEVDLPTAPEFPLIATLADAVEYYNELCDSTDEP